MKTYVTGRQECKRCGRGLPLRCYDDPNGRPHWGICAACSLCADCGHGENRHRGDDRGYFPCDVPGCECKHISPEWQHQAEPASSSLPAPGGEK